VEDAAVRETREEACLDVRLTGLLNVYSSTDHQVIIIVYTAEIIGGKLAAGDETLDARYYPLEGIPWPDLAFPSTAEALRDFFKMQTRSKGAAWS
jgi:ADP-ribose pyrophosphatase YjhB (NUDIX family)